MNKPYVTLERVRRLRVEVPKLARVIEITSVEDHKGRGWNAPLASIEGAGSDARIGASEVSALMQALTEAFDTFEREFGSRNT